MKKLITMKNKIKILLILFLTLVMSCTEFLDVPPEKKNNLEIETTEALDLLLNYYNVIFDRSREYVLAHDNYGIYEDYYDARPSRFLGSLKYILWYPEWLQEVSYYWQNQWQKIAYANTILATVDDEDVIGPDADKKRLKEDAHLLRAYENFQLAVLYCLPYSSANMDALGLPIKKTLAYDEDLTRVSLDETMIYIEDEIEYALQTTEPREDDLWRISLPAAQAMAARFYLYIHDYEKALYYADLVLQDYSVLVNIEEYFTPLMRTYSSSGGTYVGPNASSDFKYPEFLFTRILYNHTYNAVPSEELLDLYDQVNDFRYEAFIVEDYSLNRAGVPGWPAYWQFGSIGQIGGLTTAEMYLIRAECLARENDIDGACDDLNALRSTRYKSGTYVDLVPSDFASVKEAVQFVIDERRREMPYTMRWYDIKRINSDPAALLDQITITRNFYEFDGVDVDVTIDRTYTLAPGDKRFAFPIPKIDIELSDDQLVQNPYD